MGKLNIKNVSMVFFFYNSIITTSGVGGIRTLILLIKETKQCQWASELLAVPMFQINFSSKHNFQNDFTATQSLTHLSNALKDQLNIKKEK